MKELLFIYNANSGRRNAFKDIAHKILSPATYSCNLCAITYGVFTEQRHWKEFREKSDLKMEFLHQDEFKKEYASKFGYKFDFPLILEKKRNNLEVFVSKKEIDNLKNAEELVKLVKKRAL